MLRKCSRSGQSDSVQPHGLQSTWLFCPLNSIGKNTGVDCHSLFQGIFPTQGWDLGLPHCRQFLYHLSHKKIQTIRGEMQNEFSIFLSASSSSHSQRLTLHLFLNFHLVITFEDSGVFSVCVCICFFLYMYHLLLLCNILKIFPYQPIYIL